MAGPEAVNTFTVLLLAVSAVGGCGFGMLMAGIEHNDRRTQLAGALITIVCYCTITIMGALAAQHP
jgi:hypothetical protein